MGAEELEMRLKTNNLSASQIQKLMSSKVQVAKDEHGLQATVWNHLCLLASIFSEDAFCYGAMTKLKLAMSKAEPEFACMAAKERTFIASFMRMVDLKLGWRRRRTMGTVTGSRQQQNARELTRPTRRKEESAARLMQLTPFRMRHWSTKRGTSQTRNLMEPSTRT